MAVNVGPNYYNTDANYAVANTGQQLVAQVAVQLLSYNPRRLGVVLTNTGANTVFVGGKASDLIASGHALPAGASIGLSSATELWGNSVTGNNVVTYLEECVR